MEWIPMSALVLADAGALAGGAGVEPGSVAVGDVNGVHFPDVVGANAGIGDAAGTLSAFLGDGAGGFAAAPGAAPETFPGGRYVALGDVDGDGRLDAFVAGGP